MKGHAKNALGTALGWLACFAVPAGQAGPVSVLNPPGVSTAGGVQVYFDTDEFRAAAGPVSARRIGWGPCNASTSYQQRAFCATIPGPSGHQGCSENAKSQFFLPPLELQRCLKGSGVPAMKLYGGRFASGSGDWL
jgi:hypothetical protein